MVKRLLFLCVALQWCTTSFSQIQFQKVLDSCNCVERTYCCPNGLIEKALKKAFEADSIEIGVLASTSMASIYFKQSNVDSFWIKINQTRQYLEQSTPTIKALYYRTLGYAMYQLSDIDSAIGCFESALNATIETKDSIGIARGWMNLSSVYATAGYRELEFDAMNKAIEMATLLENRSILTACYLNYGSTHLETGDFPSASKYFRKAFFYADTLSPDFGYLLLGQGDLFSELKKIDSARINYQKAIRAAKRIGDLYLELGIKNNYGQLEQTLGNNNKAIKLLDEVVENGQHFMNPFVLSHTYANLGMAYSNLKSYEKSRDYLEKSIELSKSVEYLLGHYEGLFQIAAVYQNMGEWEKAYWAMSESTALQDSISETERLQNLDELRTEYETEKKKQEARLAQLEKEAVAKDLEKVKKRETGVIAGALVLILLLSVIVYYYGKLQKSQLTIRSQRDQLAELDKSKSTFFVNIAHELKTPLTLIKAPLDQVLNSPETNIADSVRQSILLARKSGQKMSDLINEILDLSKLENGKLSLNAQPTLLQGAISLFFNAFESLASSKRIEFQLSEQLDPELTVFLDAQKFEHVFNNLVGNALKYTPKKGRVHVAVKWEKELLSVEVSDNGPGIAQEDRDSIFNRFYQGSSGTNSSGGTGVGLAYSYEIAQIMGGDLHMSENQTEGLTMVFTCRAPISLEPAVPTTAVEDHEYLPTINTDKTHRLLVVEDNLEMRKYLSNLLGRYFEIEEAENGKEALKLLETTKVDLITADVMMPDMDGFEMLTQVKAQEETHNTPFILLTAREDEELKLASLRLGVDDYIQKPFVPRELLARVNALLQNVASRKSETSEVAESSVKKSDNLVGNAEKYVLANLKDSTYQVANLADDLATSERSLYRNLKKETGLTPTKFINEIRLREARELLLSKAKENVSDVAYAVGYDSASYFTRLFKTRYGALPSEYLKK